MRLRGSLVVLIGFVGATVGSTGTALAEGSDPEHARALFREARKLASDGHYAEACPKFQSSLDVDPGMGTKYNLADCLEHVGKTVSARTLFLEVAESAREAREIERERLASARAEALKSKLSHVTVQVPNAPEGLRVTRDDVAVEPRDFGVALLLDPGAHEIRASATGRTPWSTRVVVPIAASVVVVVPDLEPTSSAPAAAVAGTSVSDSPPRREVSPSPIPPAAPAVHEEPPHDSTRGILQGITLGGAGLGAVVAVTGLGIYLSNNNSAKSICPAGSSCTQADVARHDGLIGEAKVARSFGYLGLGVAAAGLAGFAIVSFVPFGNRENGGSATVAAGPVVGDGSWGASMSGDF